MRVRSTILWITFIGIICLTASWIIAFLAQDLYPDFAGPIVLVGVLATGLLLFLVVYRMLLRGRRAEFEPRLRKSEPALYLAIALSSVGCLLMRPGGVLEGIGGLLSVVGLGIALWIVLKSIPL